MPLEVVVDPGRALVRSIVRYVKAIPADDVTITVLITELEPRRRRHALLRNQRGALPVAALRARTGALVATLPFRLHD